MVERGPPPVADPSRLRQRVEQTAVTKGWTTATPGQPQHSSPALGAEDVYVGTKDGRVLALAASGGALEWGVSVGQAVYSQPAVSGGKQSVSRPDRLHDRRLRPSSRWRDDR